MNAAADRYRRNAARLTEIVEAVPPDAWERPSPCEGWSAAEVLEHVITSEQDFLQRMPFGADVTPEGTRRERWEAIRDVVQAALDDPARAGHEYDGWFGRTTFEATVDRFYSFDLVVHGWDIARATGLAQYEPIPADEQARITADVEALGDAIRQPGVLAAALEVGPTADEQTRFLALLGRRA